MKKTGVIIAVISFLCGVIAGFLLAPIKLGIGNNCGNNYHYYKDEE
jgi:hypothetical protein